MGGVVSQGNAPDGSAFRGVEASGSGVSPYVFAVGEAVYVMAEHGPLWIDATVTAVRADGKAVRVEVEEKEGSPRVRSSSDRIVRRGSHKSRADYAVSVDDVRASNDATLPFKVFVDSRGHLCAVVATIDGQVGDGGGGEWAGRYVGDSPRGGGGG